MSKLKFEPSDFKSVDDEGLGFDQVAADIANAKLDAWLSEATVVYARKNDNGYGGNWRLEPDTEFDTHRALLVNIEEIAKEPRG
jgi:hypothetical protein